MHSARLLPSKLVPQVLALQVIGNLLVSLYQSLSAVVTRWTNLGSLCSPEGEADQGRCPGCL